MSAASGSITVPDAATLTLGLAVFLLGASVNRRVASLRDLNIPEPVTGGLLAAAALWLVHSIGGIDLEFETESRDLLLVVFFAGIGLNARLADLAAGGRPLAILLALTVGLVAAQNVVGVIGATAFGMPAASGALLGSASLIGGHGTALAWAPVIAAEQDLPAAGAIAAAAATLGLVAAALIGGPLAGALIRRRRLAPERPEEGSAVGAEFAEEAVAQISAIDMMRTVLALNVSILAGAALHEAIGEAGLRLPLFVPCLVVGIVVGNLLPRIAPGARIVRSPALALVSDYALGAFLAVSMMSLQLWTLVGLAAPLLVVLGAQILLATAWAAFLVFPAMGGGYRAAVLTSGFVGFGLGSTPTAIANMTAVTKRHGPAPLAFVILPLVSAFFVDLVNAAAIQIVLLL